MASPANEAPAAPPPSMAMPLPKEDNVHDHDDLHRINKSRRRRCRCICLLVTLGALLLLGITLLVLFLTVLRVRDPSTQLLSARFVGLQPSLNQLNFTVLLTVSVHNPNPASFSYDSGTTGIWYRGAHVGDAQVDPGHIPSKGDGVLQLELTVLTSSFMADLAQLLKDLEAGALPLDSSARIPGKVALLGVFKLKVVAYSDCHIVIGFPDMRIRSQMCHDHAKL
ncbi:uncharacterized protein LOC100830877 [Brachypodium distachyon]|uniref:Late embryogenesis abundant protein LEA-2 subgroup domain-containing protein n=1 Tax=Brachypodium distachyon TaxID=15368 RepID=A0A0Q3JQU3_BRADI|nr:uncharacterized protein LOC100830877 [Brachypodium distachyon]KQK14404.1 hypothetical protein BRADI_1g15980v3 [Brachypodium distachyon]|eukprot:XP_003559726.2 uncharacterized protein LOC100830877 [Brachypodium distachyon]